MTLHDPRTWRWLRGTPRLILILFLIRSFLPWVQAAVESTDSPHGR